ncbi:hypothetical protein TNCV_301301 [Trichonephila clavipes]|nr:hypothetical protein TNCV_301301 [Trichonephila clavipes]
MCWCHAEDISYPSTRSEAIYDKWIPSNDVFEKWITSAICASAWRRSFRKHSDTKATFSTFCDVEGRSTHSLPSMHRTTTAGSDVVQSGRPIFDDFFQHLWPYIGNNTANVVLQMVKRLWLIRIDQ